MLPDLVHSTLLTGVPVPRDRARLTDTTNPSVSH